MTFLAIILSFLNAYLIARFARNKFGLTLGGSFLLSALAAGAYSEVAFNVNVLSSGIYWGTVLGFALLTYFLANPLRYFIAWFIGVMIIILTVILPLDLEINSTVSAFAFLSPIIPIYIFRKQIKVLLVGLLSGINLALGLMILLFKVLPYSSYEMLASLSSPLFLIGAFVGVYFQFKLYEKYFPAESIESSSEPVS